MAGSHKVSQGQFLIASCRPACRAAIAAVRSALYNHIRIICSHYWCPDMRFGRRRQPLVRHRGRLSLRCKNDYPPPPQPPPGPLAGPKGGSAPRPLSAHARRGGPVVGPPQPPLPWGPLSGPRGEGGHLSLQGPLQVPVYIQTARLNQTNATAGRETRNKRILTTGLGRTRPDYPRPLAILHQVQPLL